jgi:hypothetical protein
MKILHRIKIFPLAVYTAITFFFPLLSIAAPWSEQDAFCLDRVILSGSYSNYSNQKTYNNCMDNADALIAAHKKSSQKFMREWEAGRIEQDRKWKEENLARKNSQLAEERREERENKREIEKYDDLFSEFE